MRSWASVLLGMAGPNAFDRDAEAQPPDGEAGEVKKAVGRSEGNAVIRANRQGQAAFPEQAFESGKRQVFPRGFERFAQQQKARSLIRNRERITVALIAQLELAFVIRAPQ